MHRGTGAQGHRRTGARGHGGTGAQAHRRTGARGHRRTGWACVAAALSVALLTACGCHSSSAPPIDGPAALPSGRGIGVVWWYPEAISLPGIFVWGGGSLALFGADGNVLPAAAAFGGK